jgi:hypothetical protein
MAIPDPRVVNPPGSGVGVGVAVGVALGAAVGVAATVGVVLAGIYGFRAVVLRVFDSVTIKID